MSANEKPQVDVPQDQPPSYQLELDDITAGDGDEALPGKVVEVHYVGVSWTTGEQFDASWDRGDTFKLRQARRGWRDRPGRDARVRGRSGQRALSRVAVSRRRRILAYGGAVVLTVAGFVSAALGGLAGQVAGIALVSLGLGGALIFGFYEVGLSEDRARAEEEEEPR
jgi:peptidylprolyl isomerase